MAGLRFQYVVKGGSSFSTVVDDGVLGETVPGEALEGADLVISLGKAEAADLGSGALTLDEGFMMGRIKIEGSMGLVMDLLPLLRSPEYSAAVAAGAGS